MKVGILAATILMGGGMFGLGGCANMSAGQSAKKVSVTTFASSEDPFSPKRRQDGLSETKVRFVGEVEAIGSTLMDVRSCNQAKTSCAWGIVKFAGTTEVKEVGPDGATLTIDLSYDLARSQSIAAMGQTVASTIPADVPALSGNRRFLKTVYLPYGQIRRVSFDYGVDFNLCVVPADKYGMPSDLRCSLDGIQTGTTAQSSLPLL